MINNNLLTKYLNLISEIANDSNLANLDDIFNRIASHFETKGRLFIAGNGGSSAISLHAATDLAKLTKDSNRINVISLNTNIPLITAYSNDENYDNVFVNILKNYEPTNEDTLVTISSSGNSKNIVNLISFCNEEKVYTCSLNGFDGGEASQISNSSIVFESKQGYYGPVEDLHMMLFHLFAHSIREDIEEIN